MEIEAKFIIPDRDTMDRLKRIIRLGRFTPGPLLSRRVRDRYLDTPERDLYQHGYTYRLRKLAGKQIAGIKELGNADSAIHERLEQELVLAEGTSILPKVWPEEGVWAQVRSIIQNQDLDTLFTVDQMRYVRELRQGKRLMAELSIDEVLIQAATRRQSLWVLEIELYADGTADDLHILSEHLIETWGLRAEPHTKFHHGLALLDQMGSDTELEVERLSSSEQATLEYIIAHSESERVRKRARLLLGWAQHIPVRRLAAEIGGSRSWAYSWLDRFRTERMSVFPDSLLSAIEPKPIAELPSISSDQALDTAMHLDREMTIDELCEHFHVDMAHARRVADHALALFDATTEIHQLDEHRRRLLETMGILHNVGLDTDPNRHHITGRDIILEHPVPELSKTEGHMLAAAVYLHRKAIKRKRLKAAVVTSLPLVVRKDMLVLAALLRMADGLDYTQGQSSKLTGVQVTSTAIYAPVSGPVAEMDAARAQAKADLWERLFKIPVLFSAPEAKSQPVVLTLAEQASETLQKGEQTSEPELPESLGLLPDDPMSEAGRKVLRFHFMRMLYHEPGTRTGEDIEELHDMRVATRRQRAAFRIFAPYLKTRTIRPHVAGLRRTARALGAVRDLDVSMHKAKSYLETLPEERGHDLDPLVSLWRAQREQAREEMLAHLDSAKYRDFRKSFRLFLETPGAGARQSEQFPPQPAQVRHVAPMLIYARWAHVHAFDPLLKDAPVTVLHALRIECKRLRYTLEFFREILGSEAKRVIAEVVRLQDHLGDLNDADVANTMLSEFLFATPKKGTSERIIAPGVVAYLAVKQQELQDLVETFPSTWARFDRPEVRRWLADAIAML